LVASSFHCRRLLYCLHKQWHGLGDAPRQGICCAQCRSHAGEPEWEIRFLTDADGPLKQGKCPGQVAVAEGQYATPMRGIHDARGLSHRFGNPEPFVSEGLALREPPQFAIAPGEVGTGGHDGHVDLTETLVVRRAIEERHSLPETVDRPTVVPLGEV